MSGKESSLQSRILAANARDDRYLLWRANVIGKAVSIVEVRRALAAALAAESVPAGIAKRVIGRAMKPLRPIDAGLPGQADLVGMRSDGRFLGVEVKAPKGRMSDHQKRFRAMVERMNGIYVVARSVDDVAGAVEGD